MVRGGGRTAARRHPGGVVRPGPPRLDRKGPGALVALGTGTADTDTVLASARDTLLPLLPSVAEAADGPVTVLTDGPVDALGELLGAVEGTTVLAATDAGLDELHSACRVFLATPTLAALTTARARNAP